MACGASFNLVGCVAVRSAWYLNLPSRSGVAHLNLGGRGVVVCATYLGQHRLGLLKLGQLFLTLNMAHTFVLGRQ